jgi:succinate-semialdehyde dehydrogenase / glutarate-semialdehyde dehydrogenase
MSAHVCDVLNPRTGAVDYQFTVPTQQELSERVTSLRLHQAAWAAAEVSLRIAALAQFAELIAGDQALLDALIQDTGRIAIAKLEVGVVVGAISRWSSDAPALLASATAVGQAGIPGIRYESYGVPFGLVGVISPWNFPLLLSLIDTIPALLAGSAVIVKPSEVTPRFINRLNQLIAQCAHLNGVLHYLAGAGATGAALTKTVDAVCFTGSVATGKKVLLACAERMIPAFLELGGKDPLVILPGSDLARASDVALRSSVQASGQACQSIERVYVHESQFDEFVRLLVDKANAMSLNYPDICDGDLGPLIFTGQASIIEAQLQDAVLQGARILCGGKIERHGGGYWLRPTVLVDVHARMKMMLEETFGPVIPVVSYTNEAQALALANDSEFGLSAAVVGPDLAQAQAFAVQLEVGAVSINDAALTSAVYEAEKQAFKSSGLGASRMGASGLTRFLRRKSMLIQSGAPFPMIGDRKVQAVTQ